MNRVLSASLVMLRSLRKADSHAGLARRDALTGLIDRHDFEQRLVEALRVASQEHGPHALLYVDLDQFKVVNDTCGHAAGDRLLCEVTGLLQSHVRAVDTLARLGGDEFGILMHHCTAEQAAKTADDIRQAIRDHRFVAAESTMEIGVSIGVVEITHESRSAASLLSAADVACYTAKDSGRNRVHLYGSEEASSRHRQMYWVSRVPRAIEDGRLELHFQRISPLSEASPSLPDFYELLVRLREPGGGLVQPDEFIPAAERFGLVAAIDRWVVQQAVDVLRQHDADGDELPLLLAVNLSGMSFGDRALRDLVLRLTEDPRIARALCFEITETAVIANLTEAVCFMRELKKRGCRFSLDDFGSGLSSLSYLKNLPVDFLKIDGAFIGNVATDAVDRSMVEAITHVGRALGIVTIAEKVESVETFAELERLGVEFGQGYYIAKPASVASLESGMRRRAMSGTAAPMPSSHRAADRLSAPSRFWPAPPRLPVFAHLEHPPAYTH